MLEIRSRTADGSDGELRGVVFGYAMHPTCTQDGTIHGDWCGWAQYYVEQAHKGCTAIFIQGCGSDANPIPRFRPGLGQLYGQVLAYAVDDVLLQMQGSSSWLHGPLRCGLDATTLPFDPLHFPTEQALQALAAGGGEITARQQRGARYQLEILARDGQLQSGVSFPAQVWGVGPSASELVMVVLTGEVVSDYAVRLKEQHGWERTWVAACEYP